MADMASSPTSPSSSLLLHVPSPRHQLGLLSGLSLSSPSSSAAAPRAVALVHQEEGVALGVAAADAWRVGLASSSAAAAVAVALAAPRPGGGGKTNAVLELRPRGGAPRRRPTPPGGAGGGVIHAVARGTPRPGAGGKTN